MIGGRPRKGGADLGWRSRPWLRFLAGLCVGAAVYAPVALASHFVWGRPWGSAVALPIGLAVFMPAYIQWSNRRGQGRREDEVRSAVPAKVAPPPPPPPLVL